MQRPQGKAKDDKRRFKDQTRQVRQRINFICDYNKKNNGTESDWSKVYVFPLSSPS